jgi:uncharacterized MAPEG superfamily protein
MTPIDALLGFTAWTLLLVFTVASHRVLRFLGGAKLTGWCRGERNPDDPAIINRIADAHANCVENLPVFAVLVLAAAAIGKLDLIAPLAPLVLYARIAQSTVHIAGAGAMHILPRAGLWIAQLVLFVLMGWKLVAQ